MIQLKDCFEFSKLNKNHSDIITGIDIGCGESPRSGFLGLDFRKTKSVDIIADASILPFRDASFYHIFSSHTIEHFSHTKVMEVIAEWVRILKKGGIFEIICPNLRTRALRFFLNPTWNDVVNIYGGQDYNGNYHTCGFSFGLLKEMCANSGIGSINRMSTGYKWIPFVHIGLHIKGIKL